MKAVVQYQDAVLARKHDYSIVIDFLIHAWFNLFSQVQHGAGHILLSYDALYGFLINLIKFLFLF